MSKLLVYLSLFLQTYNNYATTDVDDSLEMDEFVDKINSAQNLWHAGKNNIEELPGGVEDPSISQAKYKTETLSIKLGARIIIPPHFDARERWPYCRTLREIPRQGKCANCWAISTLAAISDILCIRSEQRVNMQLSAADVTTCCRQCVTKENGCVAGTVEAAVRYWIWKGAVTGSHYETEIRGCKPYPETLKQYREGDKLFCVRECTNPDYSKTYREDLKIGRRIGAHLVRLPSMSVRAIQWSIMNSGPVISFFTVYKDFRSYKRGIFIPVSKDGKFEWHVTNILGWGTEDGVDYWLARNSWGRKFGELGGYFKIRRGYNDREIESWVYTISFRHRRSLNDTLASSFSIITLPNFVTLVLGLFSTIIVFQ